MSLHNVKKLVVAAAIGLMTIAGSAEIYAQGKGDRLAAGEEVAEAAVVEAEEAEEHGWGAAVAEERGWVAEVEHPGWVAAPAERGSAAVPARGQRSLAGKRTANEWEHESSGAVGLTSEHSRGAADGHAAANGPGKQCSRNSQQGSCHAIDPAKPGPGPSHRGHASNGESIADPWADRWFSRLEPRRTRCGRPNARSRRGACRRRERPYR